MVVDARLGAVQDAGSCRVHRASPPVHASRRMTDAHRAHSIMVGLLCFESLIRSSPMDDLHWRAIHDTFLERRDSSSTLPSATLRRRYRLYTHLMAGPPRHCPIWIATRAVHTP